jgi:hypothetical protein
VTTNLTELTDVTSTSAQPRPGPSKLLLLLMSLAFSGLLFFALDWFHTARLHRSHKAAAPPDSCQVLDPLRHHVFKPNCSSTEYWGTDSFRVFTNSLGFRDQKIRDVPRIDARPRILMLGDSHVEAKIAWRKSFAGMIAAQFPQYDFLNAGLSGYSPSNYFNTTRMLLDQGYRMDEVIVFLDNSAVQLEAGFYRDIDAAGDVAGIPQEEKQSAATWYANLRGFAGRHLSLTYSFLRQLDRVQRRFVLRGFYHLPGDFFGDPFDPEFSAWSYRQVNETDRFPAGYAPLGVDGGIAKAQAKMTQLYELLRRRNIPISVVVYPHLAQVVHDTAESRQVRLWREWCEGKCKRFVSVFPTFYAAKDQCPPNQAGCWYPALFVFGDIHYAAGGNALVADAVIASLTQDPPAKKEETAAPTASSQRTGAQ